MWFFFLSFYVQCNSYRTMTLMAFRLPSCTSRLGIRSDGQIDTISVFIPSFALNYIAHLWRSFSSCFQAVCQNTLMMQTSKGQLRSTLVCLRRSPAVFWKLKNKMWAADFQISIIDIKVLDKGILHRCSFDLFFCCCPNTLRWNLTDCHLNVLVTVTFHTHSHRSQGCAWLKKGTH